MWPPCHYLLETWKIRKQKLTHIAWERTGRIKGPQSRSLGAAFLGGSWLIVGTSGQPPGDDKATWIDGLSSWAPLSWRWSWLWCVLASCHVNAGQDPFLSDHSVRNGLDQNAEKFCQEMHELDQNAEFFSLLLSDNDKSLLFFPQLGKNQTEI